MTSIPTHPLTPELIADYRTILTRCKPADLDGHRVRVQTAQRLAARAFLEKDAATADVVLLVKWRLQKRSNLRPTEPGDVHVLDTIYRVEQASYPVLQVPRNLSGKQFSELLENESGAWSGSTTETFSVIRSGAMSTEEMRYVAYQSLPAVNDFLRMMAIALPRFELPAAVAIAENLWDEAGNGSLSRAHVTLFHDFARHFGADTDEEVILDWAQPLSIEGVATTHRHLWSYELGTLLGTLYAVESTLAVDLPLFVEGFEKAKLEPEAYEWFTVHTTADEKHAADWVQLMETHFSTYEVQQAAYTAAMQRGVLVRKFWDAIHPGFLDWKATGQVRRLPARELREQTGM